MVARSEEQVKVAKMGFFKEFKKEKDFFEKKLAIIINTANHRFELTDAGLTCETEDGSLRTFPIDCTFDAELARIINNMSRRCFLKLILRIMYY